MKTLDDIPLSQRDRSAIEEASCILLRSDFVEKIILFGSKARGDDDRESDIDLLVLTNRPFSRAERHSITDALFELELRFQVVISTIVVTSDAWHSGPFSVLPIHGEIEEQGVAA